MENNLYDYNYNDIIKAKEIIERIQAICDKEAENNKEDIIEFVKYNNMARNCASTCLLLNYYANKINDRDNVPLTHLTVDPKQIGKISIVDEDGDGIQFEEKIPVQADIVRINIHK